MMQNDMIAYATRFEGIYPGRSISHRWQTDIVLKKLQFVRPIPFRKHNKTFVLSQFDVRNYAIYNHRCKIIPQRNVLISEPRIINVLFAYFACPKQSLTSFKRSSCSGITGSIRIRETGSIPNLNI